MTNKSSTINKKSTRPYTALICLFFLMGALLLGCGASDNQSASSNTTASTKTSEAATTREYTDYKGHTVNIPTTPRRIAYFGENYGDLLVLGVQAVGTSTSMIEGKVYEKQVQNVADLGFPINLEKALELQPDLIITADTDEKQYAALTKIAPTIMFDTFAPLNERLLHLGDIVNKKKDAEDWLAQYKIKEAEMWTKLHAEGVKAGKLLQSLPTIQVTVYSQWDGQDCHNYCMKRMVSNLPLLSRKHWMKTKDLYKYLRK